MPFIALVFAAFAFVTPAAAEEPRFTQGVLWKVERDGSPASHVFGTIHLSDPRLRDLPEQVRQPFVAARSAVFELPDDPQGPALMTQAMVLSDGRQLDQILGPELFAKVAEAATRYNLPPQALRPLKPWALSVFLVAPPAEMARKARGEKSFDEWLRSEAQRRGKPVHGLESYREQIAVFDGMTEAEQVAMVRDLVVDSARAEGEFAQLFQAYIKSDIGAILDQMNDMSGVSDPAAAERFRQRLIYDRNITMTERMQPYLAEGQAFIAIGAAHLPGDGGVLDLLEKQGYQVTRVY